MHFSQYFKSIGIPKKFIEFIECVGGGGVPNLIEIFSITEKRDQLTTLVVKSSVPRRGQMLPRSLGKGT